MAHGLAGDGRLATQRAAELADEPAATPVVDVDVLAGQRRAPTVGTANAAAQEEALELLDVSYRSGHRRLRISPSTALLLPPVPARRVLVVCMRIARGT